MGAEVFNRRELLLGAGSAALLAGCGSAPVTAQPSKAELAFAGDPVRKLTEQDWAKKLPPDAFQVLRHEATEYPGTSPLLEEHRKGIFACLGCDLPLFESKWKYDSGTGWPSFWRKID